MVSATFSTNDALLLSAVRQLQVNEATHIKATLANYTTPDAVSGVIPHATAIHENRLLIVITATRLDLCQPETGTLWQALFLAATKLNGYFVVVVSDTDAELAEAVLHDVCGEAANAMIWSA